MKTYKVTIPVSVISRRFSRSFEKTEASVTEAELAYAMEHFRSCFEEVAPKTAEPATAEPIPEA